MTFKKQQHVYMYIILLHIEHLTFTKHLLKFSFIDILRTSLISTSFLVVFLVAVVTYDQFTASVFTLLFIETSNIQSPGWVCYT